MEIMYLGTGAAEGIPAVFCTCSVCETARKRGDRDIRTRSQALIDGEILLDFGPDTFLHGLRYGIDYSKIASCLVTHAHGDHLYRHDIICRKHNRALLPPGTPPLILYGGLGVEEILAPDERGYVTKDGNVRFRRVEAFCPIHIQHYVVTPLPAVHGTADPFVYVIDDGAVSLLYCHDSDLLSIDVLQYCIDHDIVFNLVSLDCTEGGKHIDYAGHMNFERDATMRSILLERRLANEATIFVASHFSHNGLVNYEDSRELAAEIGFVAAYDGLKIAI